MAKKVNNKKANIKQKQYCSKSNRDFKMLTSSGDFPGGPVVKNPPSGEVGCGTEASWNCLEKLRSFSVLQTTMDTQNVQPPTQQPKMHICGECHTENEIKSRDPI